jgi:acyl-CoA dehydrogenase
LELKVNKAVKSGQIEALDYRGQIAEAKKLRVLTAAEAKQLLHAQELVAEIISVDEFDAEELKSALPRKSKQGKKTPHAA